MSNLATDAEASRFYVLGKELLNDMTVLRKIEDELELAEKISLIFLMSDYETLYRLLNYIREPGPYLVSTFIDETKPKNWEEKLVEAISLIQRMDVLRKLGIPQEEVQERYLPFLLDSSVNVDIKMKRLYKLCELLDENQTKRLLDSLHKDNEERRRIDEQFGRCLEVHLLHFIQSGDIAITSDGKWNMSSLLKSLKELQLSDSEEYRGLENLTDSNYCCDVNAPDSNSIQSVGNVDSYANPNLFSDDSNYYRIMNGKCIIINEEDFTWTKYENRTGTNYDRDRLVSTFGPDGFGFETKVFENLKSSEINDLNIAAEVEGCDCVVLAILSHGLLDYRKLDSTRRLMRSQKIVKPMHFDIVILDDVTAFISYAWNSHRSGKIIASDGQECEIGSIIDKLCCRQLRDIPKILLIQACQGTVTGHTSNLCHDGPSPVNIADHADLYVFIATIPGLISIRDKKDGSWFIQTLCKVLTTTGKSGASLDSCATEVKKLFCSRAGASVNKVKSAGQLPNVSHNTLTKKLRFSQPPS